MQIDHLPEPLRAFVIRSLSGADNDDVAGIQLEQRGEMRLSPGGEFMPFTAEQFIAARRTRFLWHARVRMAPFVTAVVDDAFEGGHGRLDAKVWGVLPVARGRGELIDRGEIQRYLAELPFCPFAFLHNPDLRYRSLGAREVRVFIGEETCRVDLRFDGEGDLRETFSDTRARGKQVQPWRGRYHDYRNFGSLRVPARAEVSWEPAGDPFVYWRGELLSLLPLQREQREPGAPSAGAPSPLA